MKILYAFNYYQLHGGENQWFMSEPDLVRARGHEPLLYTRDNQEIEGFSRRRKLALFWEVAWSGRTYREVRALIRRERPALAHVFNTLALISPSILVACRDEGLPVVQTLYNYRLVCPAATLVRRGRVCEECLDHSLLRSVVHRCYRGSAIQSAALARMLWLHRRRGTFRRCVDAFIVPAEFMRRKLVAGGLPEDRIVVKPNWHDPDPGVGRHGGGRCLYAGRLSPEKGILTALAAWRTTGGLPPLVVMGDGPLAAEVERLAAGTASPVEVRGRVPHAAVIDAMREALCYLLPAEWYEAFPHTILEAYGCGTPVVASRLGTLADVVEDGVTGLLYAPGDAAAMAAAVCRLAADPALRATLGAAARRQFLERYSADSAYRNLLAIYERVLQAH